MARLSYAQLEGVWIRAGGDKAMAPVMAAIAEAESGGDPQALNPEDNGGTQSSFGLWQISTGTHVPPAPDWADPAANARLAMGKLQDQGLGAWGTYTSGAYKAFLSGGTSPDYSAAGTQATAAAKKDDCLIGLPNLNPASSIPVVGRLAPSTAVCLLSRSQGRAVLGGALILAGGVVFLMGGIVLAAYGLRRTGALGAAARAAGAVPGGGAAAAALSGAEARVAEAPGASWRRRRAEAEAAAEAEEAKAKEEA